MQLKIVRNWMSMDLTDEKSALVQVMASHYLSQCWPRSMLPYGVNRSQWVNDFLTHFKDNFLDHFLWNFFEVNAIRPHWWLVNIGSGKWLGAMRQQSITWTSVDQDLWCHMALMSAMRHQWVPDYFGRNKISSGGDLSHYSSASLY